MRNRSLVTMMTSVIALVAIAFGASPATAAVEPSTVTSKVAKNVMDCSGLGVVPLQRQMTFGNSNWVAQMGTRSDGAVGFKVFHPSGRWDRYRIRLGYTDGTESVAQEYYTSFCLSRWTGNGLRWVSFEADNGYGWKVSSRWWL